MARFYLCAFLVTFVVWAEWPELCNIFKRFCSAKILSSIIYVVLFCGMVYCGIMTIASSIENMTQKMYNINRVEFISQYEDSKHAAIEKQSEIQERGSITLSDFHEMMNLYEVNLRLENYHKSGDLTEYAPIEFEIVFERP